MTEIDINGVPAILMESGHAIGRDGTVWSFLRSMGPKRGNKHVVDLTRPPKMLKPRPNTNGYLRVHLSRASGDRYIHRLVWESWEGPIPEGKQVCHNDGDRSNNALDNLRLDTPKGNDADKDRHGTRPLCEGHSNSRMTSEIVIEARRLWKADMSLDSIIELMGLEVNRGTLHEAVTGRTWKSLDGVEPPAPGTHWTKKPEERSRRGWSSL